MSWNNGFERNKFIKEQEKLSEEYRKSGMSEEQIQAMHKFDLDEFRGNRIYRCHTQPLENISERIEDNERNSVFSLAAFAQNDNPEPDYSNPFWWIEQLDSSYDAVSKLSYEDKELLTLLVLHGYSETEVAREFYKVSRNAISKRVLRIRKKLLLNKQFKEGLHNED